MQLHHSQRDASVARARCSRSSERAHEGPVHEGPAQEAAWQDEQE
jgi:hypothetical protein